MLYLRALANIDSEDGWSGVVVEIDEGTFVEG